MGAIRKMLREGGELERQSAIGYFGYGCPKELTLAVRDDLVAIMRDPQETMSFRAAAAGSLCWLAEEAYPYFDDMLKLVVADKPDDPLGRIDEQLGRSLNILCADPYAAGLVKDKELFYAAVHKLLDHKRANGRTTGAKLIANIPLGDFHHVADKVLYIIDDKDLTYHSYHNLGPKTEIDLDPRQPQHRGRHRGRLRHPRGRGRQGRIQDPDAHGRPAEIRRQCQVCAAEDQGRPGRQVPEAVGRHDQADRVGHRNQQDDHARRGEAGGAEGQVIPPAGKPDGAEDSARRNSHRKTMNGRPTHGENTSDGNHDSHQSHGSHSHHSHHSITPITPITPIPRAPNGAGPGGVTVHERRLADRETRATGISVPRGEAGAFPAPGTTGK